MNAESRSPGPGSEINRREKTSTTTGCLSLVVVFIILSSILVTSAIVIGSVSASVNADFVARTMQPLLCPPNSTAEIVTYASSILDENQTRLPATAYELQCVDSTGAVLREPGPAYAFYWIATLATVALVLSLILSVILSRPLAAFLNRIINSKTKTIK